MQYIFETYEKREEIFFNGTSHLAMTVSLKELCFQWSSNEDWFTRKGEFRIPVVRNSPKSFRWGEKEPLYTIFLPDVRNEKLGMIRSEYATPKYAPLPWGLFWSEGNWESEDTENILPSPFQPKNKGVHFPLWVVPSPPYQEENSNSNHWTQSVGTMMSLDKQT